MTKAELYQRMLGLLEEASASKEAQEELAKQEIEQEDEEDEEESEEAEDEEFEDELDDQEQAVLSSPLPPGEQPEAAPILNTRQLNAIDLIIRGATDGQTAHKIGVTRQTVCYWRHHNPAFIAELNFRRQALWGANAERLRNLASKAIQVLDKGLESTYYREIPYRHRAAVHILRAIGLYGKHLQPQGEISPEAVAQGLTHVNATPVSREFPNSREVL